MASTETMNGSASREVLAPPADKQFVMKDKFSLFLQLIWISLLVIPCILWDLVRKIVPPQGKSLRDRVVLVTGAGRGLGRGLALQFAKEGCSVAVADINRSAADETAAEITAAGGVAKAYYTNVAKIEEVKQLRQDITKDLGRLDILVNNAGLVLGNPLELCTDAEIQGIISVNMMSHFWMIREFLPEMKKRNEGHIVAICSAAGLTGLANAGPYTASKFGVRGIMEFLRAELQLKSNNKIKTTTIYPYFINTSADYVDYWNIRIPPLTIEETVEATINAVKRDAVHVSVPGYVYSAVQLSKLLPQYIQDSYHRLFHTEVIAAPEDIHAQIPSSKIIKGLSRHDLG